MVQTRAGHLLALFQEQARESRVIALDGLVCRVSTASASAPASEAPRERSPRRRVATGVLTPELYGEIAPAGSYIRRYFSHSLAPQ